MAQPVLVQATLQKNQHAYVFIFEGEELLLTDRAPFGRFDGGEDTVGPYRALPEKKEKEEWEKNRDYSFRRYTLRFQPLVEGFWKELEGELKKIGDELRARRSTSVAEDICVARRKKGKKRWRSEQLIGRQWHSLKQYAAAFDYNNDGIPDKLEFRTTGGVQVALSAIKWDSKKRCWKIDPLRTGVTEFLSRLSLK